MRRSAIIVALGLLASGCASRFVGVSSATSLSFQTEPTYGNLYTLAEEYADEIERAAKHDTVYPGMYAEYGVALAMMEHGGEACRMLNMEAKLFPQSRPMVERLKASLLPSMMMDTTVPQRSGADLAKLRAWVYDSVTALQMLPSVASVIDSTDSVRVMQQTPQDSVEYEIRLTANQKREMLREEQQRAEKRRQFVADSTAAAKQAAIDAKKQAAAEKQKAKKERDRLNKQKRAERQKAARAKAKQSKSKKPSSKKGGTKE